jgi:hypothetical protein
VPDLAAPTEYFGLNVALVDRGSDGDFGLSVENREAEAWTGRIPVVWVQSGVSWVEILDVTLGPHETQIRDLRTRWAGTGGALECRLPVERSPHDLLPLTEARISEWALAANYLPLGRRAVPSPPRVVSADQDRRDRVRQALWLTFALVLGIAAVVLILYATSVV